MAASPLPSTYRIAVPTVPAGSGTGYGSGRPRYWWSFGSRLLRVRYTCLGVNLTVVEGFGDLLGSASPSSGAAGRSSSGL